MLRLLLFLTFFASFGVFEASANDWFKQKLPLEADKIRATIQQIVIFNAVAQTFRDSYAAYPGDMIAADKRLPECSEPCRAGNGNGLIDGAIGDVWVQNDERANFWIHLDRSGLINVGEGPWEYTQYSDNPSIIPSSPLGGVFHVGYHKGGVFPYAARAIEPKMGHYFVLTKSIKGDFSEEDAHFLTPEQARDIDLKFDDGLPKTGSVVAFGQPQCLAESNEYLTSVLEPCFSLLINLD